MRLLVVDDSAQPTNNRPVNYAEIGKTVRQLRAKLGWNRSELSRKSKVSLGSLFSLEHADSVKRPRQTSATSLRKIAKALDVPFDALILGRSTSAPAKDPELNEEHLAVARAYAFARRAIRDRIDALLAGKEDPRITKLMVMLQKLEPDDLSIVEALTVDLDRYVAARKKSNGPHN